MQENPQNTPEQAARDLRGVRGWLLLYCLSLVAVVPGITVVQTLAAWRNLSAVLAAPAAMRRAFVAHLLLELAVAAFSLHAGLALWRIKPNAVRIAQRYLLIALLAPFAQAAISLWSMAATRLPLFDPSRAAGDVSAAVVYCAIWFAYLKFSKRVRATYATNA